MKTILVLDSTEEISKLVRSILVDSHPGSMIIHVRHGDTVSNFLKARGGGLDVFIANAELSTSALVEKVLQDHPKTRVIVIDEDESGEPKGHKAHTTLRGPLKRSHLAEALTRKQSSS